MFRLVTGHDFARSIRWARQQPPNPITAALRQHRMNATTQEFKLISRARFFAGGLAGYGETMADDRRSNSIINPAVVEFNGIRLLSATPQSAAEAEKINRALGA